MEKLEEKPEREIPRCFRVLGIPLGILAMLITIITWCSITLILFGCSTFQPVTTSPHGYVILINSHKIAVEHENCDKPGKGVIRVYQYPFGHNFTIGDSISIGIKY